MQRNPEGLIRVSALDPQSFAPFGQVIQNPATHHGRPNVNKVEANQGSATKWLDITSMKDFYHQAATNKKARVAFNMFVCKPRPLTKSVNGKNVFEVAIMERHPYTPQTFIPLSLDRADQRTYYLVIVAPTVASQHIESKHNLRDRVVGAISNSSALGTALATSIERETEPKGPGLPDLNNIQAFIARGDQCVTYGAGTWHAPMVVLGEREIEFVVVQHVNGVAEEDCQEVEIKNIGNEVTLAVLIDESVTDCAAVLRPKL